MSFARTWIEVRVTVPDGWGELVADLFADAPFTGVAFGPATLASTPAPSGTDYLRTFVPLSHDSEVLRADIRTRVDQLGESVGLEELRNMPIRFHALPAEDWANSWKRSWKAFRCGDLAVIPKHYEGQLRASDVPMKLDPGGVFGTGRHATTRTIMLMMQARMLGGERVLDAGTGTGILACAAALLGARDVLGFDIDSGAASHYAELMHDNGVADSCKFREGGFEVLGEGDVDFDVILANIYADIIIENIDDLVARLAPSGWFAFSGCHRAHADDVRESLGRAGLVIEEERVRGLWHTMVGRHA
jgi:ribosomal protein L11 methyltransferase